ncbi:MAG: aldolase [Spirochaetia bacterium]|nr:aldolase [Spirochaetia bacterium]
MKKEYKDLIELGKYLVRYRYASGSAGNISLRLASGFILASPTNSHLGSLNKGDLSLLDENGKLVSGLKPTKEIELHLAIYKSRREANAVIHLHSTYLTALSCISGLDPLSVLDPVTPYVLMRTGKIPLIPYFKPGSIEIASEIEKLSRNHSSFLLANHGIVVSGRSISEACHNFEEIEETAKLRFILKKEKINYLTDENIAELGKGALK